MRAFCLKISPTELSSGSETEQALSGGVTGCIWDFYIRRVSTSNCIIQMKSKCFIKSNFYHTLILLTQKVATKWINLIL